MVKLLNWQIAMGRVLIRRASAYHPDNEKVIAGH
jgi:hypothetical protein